MKKIMAIMLIGLLVLPAVVMAETEDPVTGAVKTVGKAAKGTVETAASPFRAMSEGKDPGHIVTDPIQQGGKTVGEAAVDTAKTATIQKVDMED